MKYFKKQFKSNQLFFEENSKKINTGAFSAVSSALTKKDEESLKQEQFSYFLPYLPNPNILATKKESLAFGKKIERPSAVCLNKSKWLKFNTKATKFLIFDIDGTNMRDFVEKPVFSEKCRISDFLLSLPPTWIISTDSGVQVGYALKDAIPRNPTLKTKKWLTAIKKRIIEVFGADERGSVRNSGIWRNPLNHDGRINLNFEYALSELADAFKVKRWSDRSKVAQIASAKPVSGFVGGNRNVALYWKAVYQINKFPESYSENSLGDWAVMVNASQENPLSESEAHKTGRSAWRQYFIYGKRLGGKGKFDFKEWKKAHNENYYKTKVRKKDTKTRNENAKEQSLKRAFSKKEKVFKAIEELKRKGIRLSKRKIAEAACVSDRTALKYFSAYKDEKANLLMGRVGLSLPAIFSLRESDTMSENEMHHFSSSMSCNGAYRTLRTKNRENSCENLLLQATKPP